MLLGPQVGLTGCLTWSPVLDIRTGAPPIYGERCISLGSPPIINCQPNCPCTSTDEVTPPHTSDCCSSPNPQVTVVIDIPVFTIYLLASKSIPMAVIIWII
eukprot:TRINITY_DN10721_c0_g1_i1.p1 TRINITY_DN10721_c0_g1~~TRINITY_DN10721_c0_g1_i1.p1  ORF type:complete len:101 (+),score=7.36 TRINITY_DN10721_c0_g1_i1:247-549(+)